MECDTDKVIAKLIILVVVLLASFLATTKLPVFDWLPQEVEVEIRRGLNSLSEDEDSNLRSRVKAKPTIVVDQNTYKD